MAYRCAKCERNWSMEMVAQSYFCKTVRRKKRWRKWGNFQEHTSCEQLGRFLSNLVCRVVYMAGIKYVNLIEIDWVIIEIWGVEICELAVPVNSNTLVRHTAFFTADTWLCVLIHMEFVNTSRVIIGLPKGVSSSSSNYYMIHYLSDYISGIHKQ